MRVLNVCKVGVRAEYDRISEKRQANNKEAKIIMICQVCGKNHATNKFMVNFMGQNNEIFVCDECIENFSQYTGMLQGQPLGSQGGNQVQGTMPSWPIGFRSEQNNKKPGSGSFDVDGVAEIRTKRKLNQLHKQLGDAVKTENYEEAAILRDKINDIKKEVFINGK